MNVLILGGTGAMGCYLTELLMLDNTITCFVTTRQSIASTNNIKYLQGNAHNMSFLRNILSSDIKYDVVVDFMHYSTYEFSERVDFLLSSTEHYVFLSSARVYANSNNPLVELSPRLLDVNDDLEYSKTDEYALTKARQEDLLKKTNKSNYSIVRPYITYSDERLQLGVYEKEDWLYRALHGRTIVFSNDIANKLTTLTYGRNVANALYMLLKNKRYGTYNITCNRYITWNEVLNIYLNTIEEVMGFRPKVHMVDISENTYNGGKWQLCKDRYYNRVFDNQEISNIIDVDKFIEPQKGLFLCLRTFLKKTRFKNINWIMEATRDRITGEWTPLSEIDGKMNKVRYLVYRLGIKNIANDYK